MVFFDWKLNPFEKFVELCVNWIDDCDKIIFFYINQYIKLMRICYPSLVLSMRDLFAFNSIDFENKIHENDKIND